MLFFFFIVKARPRFFRVESAYWPSILGILDQFVGQNREAVLAIDETSHDDDGLSISIRPIDRDLCTFPVRPAVGKFSKAKERCRSCR